jgi:hypothetical protein
MSLLISKPQVHLKIGNRDDIFYDLRVKVKCITSNENIGTFSLEWIRLVGGDMPRKSYVIGNYLVINRFDHTDLGEYACIVTNDAGQTVRTIKFFDLDGELKFLINNRGINYELDESEKKQLKLPNNVSNNSSISNKDIKQLKFAFGSLMFNLGETVSIECFNKCKLNLILINV